MNLFVFIFRLFPQFRIDPPLSNVLICIFGGVQHPRRRYCPKLTIKYINPLIVGFDDGS